MKCDQIIYTTIPGYGRKLFYTQHRIEDNIASRIPVIDRVCSQSIEDYGFFLDILETNGIFCFVRKILDQDRRDACYLHALILPIDILTETLLVPWEVLEKHFKKDIEALEFDRATGKLIRGTNLPAGESQDMKERMIEYRKTHATHNIPLGEENVINIREEEKAECFPLTQDLELIVTYLGAKSELLYSMINSLFLQRKVSIPVQGSPDEALKLIYAILKILPQPFSIISFTTTPAIPATLKIYPVRRAYQPISFVSEEVKDAQRKTVDYIVKSIISRDCEELRKIKEGVSKNYFMASKNLESRFTKLPRERAETIYRELSLQLYQHERNNPNLTVGDKLKILGDELEKRKYITEASEIYQNLLHSKEKGSTYDEVRIARSAIGVALRNQSPSDVDKVLNRLALLCKDNTIKKDSALSIFRIVIDRSEDWKTHTARHIYTKLVTLDENYLSIFPKTSQDLWYKPLRELLDTYPNLTDVIKVPVLKPNLSMALYIYTFFELEIDTDKEVKKMFKIEDVRAEAQKFVEGEHQNSMLWRYITDVVKFYDLYRTLNFPTDKVCDVLDCIMIKYVEKLLELVSSPVPPEGPASPKDINLSKFDEQWKKQRIPDYMDNLVRFLSNNGKTRSKELWERFKKYYESVK